MEQLRVHLFGGFLLEREGDALPPIPSRAGRSLFAYLVTRTGRPQQREALAERFWPELAEGRARRRLSHTLWQIQDVVSTGSTSYLKVDNETLEFDSQSPYWLDVEEFDKHFALAEGPPPESGAAGSHRASVLRTCVDLYRGDFLAGYFDDWVVLEQDHYRQRYLTSLHRLVEAMKAAGAYEEALAYARRLTHHDPLSEETHQEVMRLCFLLGRTGDAVEQYRRCRSVLEEELGTEPSRATVELYERILRRRRAGIRTNVTDPELTILSSRRESPFVGREDERRLLLDAVERVLVGPGGIALIEGEPGVGKTRLASELVDDARWRGFEVSWGSCRPGALHPFGPLIEILESLTPLRLEQLAEQVSPVWFNHALRLAPGLAHRAEDRVGPAALRPTEELTRTQEALVHSLAALGRIAPHLMVIDDVHWVDRDTLGVLTQLASRLAGTRVLVLLMFRSEEARGEPDIWDVIRDLDRVAGLGRAVLSPLSVFELEEMVRRILDVPRLQPAVAASLHRQTGGNALFALETLLAMRDRGSFEGGGELLAGLGTSGVEPDPPVAPRVREVIESRISLLGDEVAHVYQVASAISDPIGLDLLEATVDVPRNVLLDAVDELIHRGLIREQGDGEYWLAHDQIRQVAYGAMAAGRRRELHQKVGEALLRLEPDRVEEIGHHFQMAGDADRTAEYLLKAGQHAIALSAYATANNQLHAASNAAKQASWPYGDRYSLLGHLEEVLGVLGRRGDQAGVIEEMADLVDSETEGDLERRRAWLLAHEGRLGDAEEMAARSVRLEQRSRQPSPGLAASLVVLGTIQRWSGRPLEAVPNLTRAVDAVKEDENQRANALTELASTLVEVQRYEEAIEALDAALGLYRKLEDLRGQAEVGGIRARTLNRHGRAEAALDQYTSTIELCTRIGYRHGEGVNLVNLANLQQLHDNVASALENYDRAAVIFSELGNRRGEALVLANSASARHNLIGDDERALADARSAMQRFVESGDEVGEAQCLEILAGVTARRGDLGKAAGLIAESLDKLDGTGNVGLTVQHLRSFALVQLEMGDPGTAIATLDRADELAADAGRDEVATELVSIRSLALARAGEVEHGLALARDAASRLTPGVERGYLVHHRHAVAADMANENEEARRAAMQAVDRLKRTLEGLDGPDRELARERVPEHRVILAMAEAYSPLTVEVELPSVEAPTGKPLEKEDRIPVTWTLDHPDDIVIESPIERRRARLVRLVNEAEAERASPTLDSLAEALDVSVSTIRRDLASMRAAGHELRTRGQRSRAS